MLDIEKGAEIARRCAKLLTRDEATPTRKQGSFQFQRDDLHVYGSVCDGEPVVRVIVYKMEYVYTVRNDTVTIERKYLNEILTLLNTIMLLEELAEI